MSEVSACLKTNQFTGVLVGKAEMVLLLDGGCTIINITHLTGLTNNFFSKFSGSSL